MSTTGTGVPDPPHGLLRNSTTSAQGSDAIVERQLLEGNAKAGPQVRHFAVFTPTPGGSAFCLTSSSEVPGLPGCGTFHGVRRR